MRTVQESHIRRGDAPTMLPFGASSSPTSEGSPMSDVPTPAPEAGAASLLGEPPNLNGHVSDPFEAKLLADLEGAITEKRDRVNTLAAERERVLAALDGELVEARAALKRYEDTRKRLVGEPLRVNRGPGRPKKTTTSAPTGTYKGSRVSPEKLEQVKASILRFAEDHDEFAQVDIRSLPDAPLTHSGGIAHAFEQLRQEGFIRFARQDGLKKLYRLTRSAVAET
jgi:hypothetical protein